MALPTYILYITDSLGKDEEKTEYYPSIYWGDCLLQLISITLHVHTKSVPHLPHKISPPFTTHTINTAAKSGTSGLKNLATKMRKT